MLENTMCTLLTILFTGLYGFIGLMPFSDYRDFSRPMDLIVALAVWAVGLVVSVSVIIDIWV